MEPISALLSGGFSLFGTLSSMQGSSQVNQAQQRTIELEKEAEGQRHQAMVLDSERKSMETLRNNQRARAMGLEAATSQGANKGSGLAGAYGQMSGQTGVNLLGISQNREIGENMFSINNKISDQKMQMAQGQQQMQFGAGMSSFGSSLFGASKPLNNLFSGFSNSTPQPNYGYGSGSGMQTGFFNS